MESSEDLIRENNYIFREIKQIGTRKIIPEQIQILENLLSKIIGVYNKLILSIQISKLI